MTPTASIGAAILASVLAEPDEDLHRLAFADWLEESGENPARAEFIRVQVALALLHHDTTSDQKWGCPICARARPLEARERELLHEHAPRWLSLLSDVILPDVPQWRRGFIDSLALPGDAWVEHADALLALHPIREVSLTSWPQIDARQIEAGMDFFFPSRRQDFVSSYPADRPTLPAAETGVTMRLLRKCWPQVTTWHLPPIMSFWPTPHTHASGETS